MVASYFVFVWSLKIKKERQENARTKDAYAEVFD